MTKLKKILAVLMSAIIVLSATACGEGNNKADSTTTPASGTTIDDDIDNPVTIGDITLDVGDDDVDIKGTELTYLGAYEIIKAGDIKPAYVYFNETYGATINCKIVGDLQVMDTLSTMIGSGQSPDLVDRRDNTFPYYISKNLYEPLDEYIDLTAPQWDGLQDYIDRYMVNGKRYYIPWAYYVSPEFLIYNRGLFQEYGIEDPYELYEQDNWTWNTFKKCMTQFVDKSDIEDALGVYGFIGTSFINSTGSNLVDFKDGKLINNLRSTEVERAMTFLESIRKEGLSQYYYGLYNNVAENPIIEKSAAFMAVGDWKITDFAKKMKKDTTGELDCFFVPFPRDPSADSYYYNLDTFGYLVPSGAKNIEAASIFINCVRLSKTDPELAETTKTSIMNNKKYTDEQYNLWNHFQTVTEFDSKDLVIDYSGCFTATTMSEIVTPMTQDILFDMDEEWQTWTEMRESNYNMLQAELDEINAMLQG